MSLVCIKCRANDVQVTSIHNSYSATTVGYILHMVHSDLLSFFLSTSRYYLQIWLNIIRISSHRILILSEFVWSFANLRRRLFFVVGHAYSSIRGDIPFEEIVKASSTAAFFLLDELQSSSGSLPRPTSCLWSRRFATRPSTSWNFNESWTFLVLKIG